MTAAIQVAAGLAAAVMVAARAAAFP